MSGERPAELPTGARVVYLIDLSGYVFRAYHALPPLSTPDRFPTHVLFGVANMLVKLLERDPDALMIAVKDAPGPSWRHEVYPEYKANRPPAPEDLKVQVAHLDELLDAFGVPHVEYPGLEADDLIAALARWHADRGWRVVVASGDKDLAQLVDDRIVLWDPMRDVVYDRAGVQAKWGVPPERIADLLALVGDSSDNVPGVPKIGPKTAQKLLRQFGTLDRLLAHLEALPNYVWARNLRSDPERVRLSRRLVSLRAELPPGIDPERLQRRPPDPGRLTELFRRWAFHTLLERLPRILGEVGEVRADDTFLSERHVEVVTDPEAVSRLLRAPRIAFDTETTSLQPRRARLVGLSGTADGQRGWYLPIGHREDPNLELNQLLPELRRWAGALDREKWGLNLKYDLQVLRGVGVDLVGITGDAMLASHLLDPDGQSHGLDRLAGRELGHRTIRFKEVAPHGDFAAVPVTEAARYAAEDALVSWALCERLHTRLHAEELWEVYTWLELPLVPVLAAMEWAGIRVDPARLEALRAELKERIADVEARVAELVGEEVNLQSPKQLATLLFERLELPTRGVRRTKSGGYTTDAETLERLRDAHPIVPLILEHRQLAKLLQTYVEALLAAILPETGRIHPSFHQASTATGRLSCSDPNLQNIPIRDQWGERLRAAFVPEEGMLFVGADYSQIELRIFAHFAEDPGLIAAFAAGEDIHRRTAADLLDKAPEAVTPTERRLAKTINFGLIYGMGPVRLAQTAGISRREAERYIAKYFERYPAVRAWREATIAAARELGWVRTLFGRKRWLPALLSGHQRERAAAERAAINTPIQGTAADIMKAAMIRLHHALREQHPRARILVQVHDELLVETPAAEAESVRNLMVEVMTEVVHLRVPLAVETGIGTSWLEAHG